MSGMCRTVGSLLISVWLGWLMLEAVDKLLVSGNVLVTDCARVTDCDLGNTIIFI